MEPARLLLLGAAAAVASVINSVAGGGSLVTFPALIASGVSPLFASATNTAALTPGGIASAWAYRRELGVRAGMSFAFAAVSALGGVSGAVLLFRTPPRAFELIVPWLVGGATLLLVFQERLMQKPSEARAFRPSRRAVVWVGVGLTSVAVYGGYFGAGIGMLTLALLGSLGSSSVHELNAMKSVIVATVNGTATVYFLATGRVELTVALVMALGATVGGYSGAALARRAKPERVRSVVVAIGCVLTVLLALRYYR